MNKTLRILTYFIVVISLLSINYTGSYFSDTKSISFSFTPADNWSTAIPCTRTQGYWKTNDEAWPANEITIGGITYTKQETIDIMWAPNADDKTYDMFNQLVTAKLNILQGCDSICIQHTLIDADTWLYLHPVGSGVPATSQAWREGEPLKNILCEYNNGELCAPHCTSRPHKPTNPTPCDHAIDVEINPVLSVYVSDPDNNTMEICFYNAANNSLIAKVVNVENNTTVSVIWRGLKYEITYEWYAIVKDHEGSTQSDIWSFTTQSPPSGGGGGNSGGGSPPLNNPPIADAGGPYSSLVGIPITFNGSGSTDDETILSYQWDFGDEQSGTGISPTHIYTEVGTYTVTLTVTDNTGFTGVNITKATINPHLEINNIIATPSIQAIGEHVNITCAITNTSQIVDVILNITFPVGTHTTVSMYHNTTENRTVYYSNQTYHLLGIFEYFIRAYDIENHTTISETYQFSITADTASIEISNISVTPEEQEINGYINITASVTDTIGVKNVNLHITNPDNATSNTSLIHLNGTIRYYHNSTYSDKGDYTFSIFATNANNNTVTSDIYYFSIVDRQPPSIVDNTPETAYKNHSFTFNATVTDTIEVSGVWVKYWYDEDEHTNSSMTNEVGYYWKKTITIPSNFNVLHYSIHAKDASNNWNYTEIKSIMLLEN